MKFYGNKLITEKDNKPVLVARNNQIGNTGRE